MKQSESAVAEKITRQKKETEQILKILNKLWPLMEKMAKSEEAGVDEQTKEVLAALGSMLGKETSQLLASNSSP